jgi:glutaredoxin
MLNNLTKIIIILIFLITPVFIVSAAEDINLYFFYGDGCPHCAKEEKFLDKLETENKGVKVFRYETWRNSDNAKLLKKIAEELNLDIRGVPVLIIGEETIVGYYNDEVTGQKILNIVYDYIENGCTDPVASILGTDMGSETCQHQCDLSDEDCQHDCDCSNDLVKARGEIPDEVHVPFFGTVDVGNVSLPVLTFLLAAADGFNPCAMWVLLFLISLLLGMKDKRRMWILGSAFIVASGAVYFLFLSAWLNLFIFLGFVAWIRISIALVALISGVLHLKSAWDSREGCKVTSGEKRQQIFKRLRVLVLEKNFWVAVIGIMLLATAVNLVELVCSAGLPAVYTSVLAMSDLPIWQYYFYLLFYILIFMLDDLIVFIIAMSTLQMKAISGKYTRWSGWVGGALMLIIGILLLFKPGLLMFG